MDHVSIDKYNVASEIKANPDPLHSTATNLSPHLILNGLALFLPSSSPTSKPRVEGGHNDDKDQAEATNKSTNQPNLPTIKAQTVA